MYEFLFLLFIYFLGWMVWKSAHGKAPPQLNAWPYDPEFAERAEFYRQRFDNPYYYSGTSEYSQWNDGIAEEIAGLRDPYETQYEGRKERHDRLWLIAQLQDHKRHLQRQWAEIEARTKAEEAKRLALLPVLAEQKRLAKLAEEQAAAQAAREAAEQAERERQAYREAIAKAASQAPNEAP